MTRQGRLLVALLVSVTACQGARGEDTSAPPATLDLVTQTEQMLAADTTVPQPARASAPSVATTPPQTGDEYFDGLRGYLLAVGAPPEVANCVALRATADYLAGLNPLDPALQQSYYDRCPPTH